MDNRKSKKGGRLFLSAKRKKRVNIQNYNRRSSLNNVPSVNKKCEEKLEQSSEREISPPIIENNMDDIFSIPSSSCVSNESTNLLPVDNVTYARNEDIPKSSNEILIGRRIVQISHFFESLKCISNHNERYGCNFNNITIVREILQGLNSILVLKCNMCNVSFQISTNETISPTGSATEIVDINTAAVEGIMSIGSGYFNLEEFFCVMEIPCMNEKTYSKYHKIVCDAWEIAAYNKMIEAGKKEVEYAIANGNVDANGIPCITVVADGCWSKRSYKTNYNALSGAAAIIGHQFGEVLYIGIKNKYCAICIHAKNSKIQVKDHACSKNFEGTSTSMESNIILEGFKSSIAMHGIKYTKLIADGDSSTYKKILDTKPYKDTTVEKIECRNHVLRNYCNKLKSVSSDTRFPLHLRKILNERVLRLRRAITSAVNFRKSSQYPLTQKIELLKNDIENSIKHVFGEHSNCDSYYCNKENIPSENNFLELKNCPELYNRIFIIIKSVSRHARSLMYNCDSNIVEQFHSVITKFIGGKRINFSKGKSYQSRCYAAVVSFNSKRRAHYTFHKTLTGISPSKIKSKFEINRQQGAKRSLTFRQNNKKQKSKTSNAEDGDYGTRCQEPDMEKDEFEREKQNFLKNLMTTEEQRQQFERNTILQAGSSYWLEERRKFLTASNFFKVCTRRQTTSCINLVKNLLYGSQISHVPAIHHGITFEPVAKEKLEEQLKIQIVPCGMFIDKEFPFLGASPDGLVGEDTIIEIKCPFNPQNLRLEELIVNKKVQIWKKNNNSNKININKHNSWFYQIQGQLRITGRDKCILAVWTATDEKMKTEIIYRDDKFWAENMEDKLVHFYNDCILPELVDSRHSRNMDIRDPEYITEAIKKKSLK